MPLVFCPDPLEPSGPDRAFDAEAESAGRLGLPYVLIDHDALVKGGDPARAVRRVPTQPTPVLAAFRGWMITPAQYGGLYDALVARGTRLINDPRQYRHAHSLPENYSVISGHTPRSVWLTGDLGLDRVMEALAPFGDAPVIVKDFVKSRKHEWAEACFIPSAADCAAVGRVVGRFLELQDEGLAVRLVFREFIEFEPLGAHPTSGVPLAEEYRAFWLAGEPLFWAPYWAVGEYRTSEPPIGRFAGVAAAVESRFFTMDLARRRDGDWTIVEIGDGQVSGLPRESDSDHFYAALARVWPDARGGTGR